MKNNKNNPWKTLFFIMKKTRAKKFLVRMFYHLQNLFYWVFPGVFGLGVFSGGFVLSPYFTDPRS